MLPQSIKGIIRSIKLKSVIVHMFKTRNCEAEAITLVF